MNDYPEVHLDAFNLLCGERIGYGMTRDVFASPLLPDCVIKVEKDPRDVFQNIFEWQTWEHVKFTDHSRWFAQCKWISPNGRILVMERTRPAAPDEFPELLPPYLTDLKRSNYGVSMLCDPKTGKPSNAFVCHDYGTNLLLEHGMTKRLRKAEWRED